MRLNKNKLPARLLDLIEQGEEKSRNEWAKHFKCSPQRISSVMIKLRKMGFMIYPVGAQGSNFTQDYKPAVLKNIMFSKTDTKEVVERNNKHEILPRMKSQFRLWEEAVSKWGEDSLEEAIEEVGQYTKFLIDRRALLKAKSHGNPTNTLRQN